VTGAASGIGRAVAGAAVSADERRTMAPAVTTEPEEIADAVMTMIDDDRLARGVMLCVGPKPWPRMEPAKPAQQ
jgi:NAD(P)-dependent dehydrogenase (short-subunit alcohol dehydrogenase family)